MAQPLSKDIGRAVPADKGKEWIKKYQDGNPGTLQAVFFGSTMLQTLLAQKECVGIRIYNAIGDDDMPTFVVVGAKDNGNNIWPSNSADSTQDGLVGEYGTPCPPGCADNL